MGIFHSKEKTDSNGFEEILLTLDKDIQSTETKISQLKIKQRKTTFMWMIYSVTVWIVSCLYFGYTIKEERREDRMISLIPVLIIPLVIYQGRKCIVWWYEKRQKEQEMKLGKLRKEQKEKIEELKKKTSYYKTQSLLEKYEEEKKGKVERKVVIETQPYLKQPTPPIPRQPTPYPHQAPPAHPSPVQAPLPIGSEPKWYDKLVDSLVGVTGPETKYALICNHCFSHNGLILKEEYDTIHYVCPVCKKFNPSRKSKQPKLSQIKQEEKPIKSMPEDGLKKRVLRTMD